MQIIGKQRLSDFGRKHADAAKALSTWDRIVTRATWGKPPDVIDTINSADHVGRWTVFNIAGNNYRLIAQIDYAMQRVHVREVMTHADYDRDKWKQS